MVERWNRRVRHCGQAEAPAAPAALVSSAGEPHSAADAVYPQALPGDTALPRSRSRLASLRAGVCICTRERPGEPASQSYLAAVVTRGLSVNLLEVNGTQTRVLGSVTSPSTAYLSGAWVRVSLVPTGTTVKVEVTRQDTGAYLNASGLWQTAETAVVTATTDLNPAQGKVGVGRNALYIGHGGRWTTSRGSAPPASTSLPRRIAPSRNRSTATAAGGAPTGWTGVVLGSSTGSVRRVHEAARSARPTGSRPTASARPPSRGRGRAPTSRPLWTPPRRSTSIRSFQAQVSRARHQLLQVRHRAKLLCGERHPRASGDAREGGQRGRNGPRDDQVHVQRVLQQPVGTGAAHRAGRPLAGADFPPGYAPVADARRVVVGQPGLRSGRTRFEHLGRRESGRRPARWGVRTGHGGRLLAAQPVGVRDRAAGRVSRV